MRLLTLIVSLGLALLLAVLTMQSPTPRDADAPADTFSATRAMVDIREIAQRPHPIGSADHARVQALLLVRMQSLGLEVSAQRGPLSPQAVRRVERSGLDVPPEALTATNLIGVLPGSRPDLPAIALMAHYDTVPDSPGAADDTTGVAAILETVRAIRARGPAERTLVVILTDAEELNLDGARIFWGGHPLRDRIGAVVNLEARGGGGRAMMFETGQGNAQTIDLFATIAGRVDGGVTSNALAVFVYSAMPNGTDFTVPRERGIQGINLAFIGRPDQYHAEASTPDALDQGSVQHIGSQALEMADALLRAEVLPVQTRDTVYADVFGRVVIGHDPAWGWSLLILAVGALGAAIWRARSHAELTLADTGRGVIEALWFVSTGIVLTQAVRLLAGPLSARAENLDVYYTLLARLPWIEVGVALAVLALALAVLGGRARSDPRMTAGAIAVASLVTIGLGGVDWVVLGASAIAIALSMLPKLAVRTVWGGWTGIIALMTVVAALAQFAVPQTAFLFLWPTLLVSLIALVAAFVDPGLTRRTSLIPIAIGAVLGVGWLMTLAHPVFLGIGMDLPAVLVLLGLLMLMFVRPLLPEQSYVRPLLAAGLTILLLAGVVSGVSRLVEPATAVEAS
ncbi:M20/M25/M40 family metallo-hydrolase [Brevundimonas sp.]